MKYNQIMLPLSDYFSTKNFLSDRGLTYIALLQPHKFTEFTRARRHQNLTQALLDITSTAKSANQPKDLFFLSLYAPHQHSSLYHLGSRHGAGRILSDSHFFLQELTSLQFLLQNNFVRKAVYILPHLQHPRQLQQILHLLHQNRFTKSHRFQLGFSIDNFASVMLADRLLQYADNILLNQQKLAQIIFAHHKADLYAKDASLLQIQDSLAAVSQKSKKPLYVY
jgi:hypothetical protein